MLTAVYDSIITAAHNNLPLINYNH